MASSTPPSRIDWAKNVITKRDSDFGKLRRRFAADPDDVRVKMGKFVASMQDVLREMGCSEAIDGDTATVEHIASQLRAQVGPEVDAAFDEAVIAPLALIQTLARRVISGPPAKKAEQPVKAEPLLAASAKKTPPLPAAAAAKKPVPTAAKTTVKAAPAHEAPAAPAKLGDSGVLEFMPADPPQEDGEPSETGETDWAAIGIDPTAPVHVSPTRKKRQPKP